MGNQLIRQRRQLIIVLLSPAILDSDISTIEKTITVMADAKLQYVISDERPIGFLLPCADGWKSYDTDGLPIGLFDSEELAAKAVYERAALPSPHLKT
jgi:hypothetical protein